MELYIHLDEETVQRYSRRGSPILIDIHWTHHGISYPSHEWTDFGLVIIEWWLIAAKGLLAGASKQTFYFMDGPYALIVYPENNLFVVSLRGISDSWKIEREEFITELIHGANTICMELERLGLDESERKALQGVIDSLGSGPYGPE